MQKSNRNPLMAFAVLTLVVCLALGLVACAPRASDAPASSSATSSGTSGVSGEYVSDKQCLSCHGGSYEANAEATADLGDWNPHDPIHGGYNSCQNCHAKDKELTNNYCANCHDYAPAQGSAA